MSNKKVLLLAIICGLLAALGINVYLNSVKEASSNLQTKKVAIAKVRIPAKTVVTADQIFFKDMPVDFVPGTAVTDNAQIVGYTARVEVEAGELILQTKLVPRENTSASLAYSIPLGMRAVSIPIDDQTGVAGLINPGDRVDVLGTVDVEIPSQNPGVNTIKQVKTHVLLQNVEVLAVGRNFTDPAARQAVPEGEGQAAPGGGTATLAVPPDKMQFVVHMVSRGKLYLTLRAPADKSEEYRPPLDALELLK